MSDETKDTFSWLFSSHLHAIGGLISKLLFTDADLAIIAVVSSTTKYHFCLFHIRKKNLEKHFLGKYRGEKWKKLFTAFCHARNSRIESTFEDTIARV